MVGLFSKSMVRWHLIFFLFTYFLLFKCDIYIISLLYVH